MRVFRIKYRASLTDIVYHQALGKVAGYAGVMEFQKRGLPHVHLAIICGGGDRVVDTTQVDLAISAELPDPVKKPRLFSIVTKWQIHSPCDRPLPSGVPKHCYRPVPGRPGELKCRFKFPQEIRDSTVIPERGPRILYRRRDSDIHFIAGGRMIDNRWVSPYNAVLYVYNTTSLYV